MITNFRHLMLFFGLMITFGITAQNLQYLQGNRFLIGYKLVEPMRNDYVDGREGVTCVALDSANRCNAYYFHGKMKEKPLYSLLVENVKSSVQKDTSSTGVMYYGKATDGTYFVEKEFYEQPEGIPQGIIMFKIPQDYYKEVFWRLSQLSTLPREILRDSLIVLMGYKLTGTRWDAYEEGRDGAALVNLGGYAQICIAYYFHGAMIKTPLYCHHIKGVEYVIHSDTSLIDNLYTSSTGVMYYGKATDGTYFVEKEFYEQPEGIPQGIIMFKIPQDYYKEVLERLVVLPFLPTELLKDVY